MLWIVVKFIAIDKGIQENQEDWVPTARRQRHHRINAFLWKQTVDFLRSENMIPPARGTSDPLEQPSTSHNE